MKLYVTLDEDADRRTLFLNKILNDHQNGFEMIEGLFDEPKAIRRNGQYDNLNWRNDKLITLHQLHLKYLNQWRNLTDENSAEKDKLLTKLLGIINAISSGLKSTG